tara:strand:+ start:2039 stop:2239 length:201 start_codon:yes stop_codon:yes gene_type:complete
MFNETQIKYKRIVYKSGKICYIGTYGRIVKEVNLTINLLEDLDEYDQFAMKYLINEIKKEVENKRR